jgi:hypothetical protein
MPARQFPIDKAPLVQPLMRAIFPGTLVDRKFLPANGLACAHPAGPNHVSAHDIETHGIKDFRVVQNFGHRVAPFSPRAQRLGPCAPPSDPACLKPGDRVDPGGPREPRFFATLCLCCNDAADRRCSASCRSARAGRPSSSTTGISARIMAGHHGNESVLHASVAAAEQGDSGFGSNWIA